MLTLATKPWPPDPRQSASEKPGAVQFALEDLEEGLLWGVLLFSVRWHHVKARSGVAR